MPDLHLKKLSCTACHSGPWPGHSPRTVQTSMAHALGQSSKDRRDDDPPGIVEPLFIRRADGKIGPHRALWPAFWAEMSDDAARPARPIPPDKVRQLAGDALSAPAEPVRWQAITPAQIKLVLERMKGTDGIRRPAYVAGGRLYTLDASGSLEVAPAPGGPMVWPIAHDVRPAGQSLGSGGCTDCHSANAAFVFGTVSDPLPGPTSQPEAIAMHTLEGIDPDLMKVWAISFEFRTLFVWVAFAAAGMLAAMLLLYALPGLRRGGRQWITLVYAGMLAALLALAASGYWAVLQGEALSGWLMIAHSMIGAAFAVALALLAIASARRLEGGEPTLTFSFWLMVFAGLVTVGAIMLSMLKSMPADAQPALYAVHRYASMALVAAVGLNAMIYLMVRFRRQPE